MTAYTKDQFEEYKGDKEFLEVQYYSNPVTVAHKTYEEYRKYFDNYYLIEQDNFERDRLIVSRELADIKSVQDYMYYCAEEDFDNQERMLVDIYRHLEAKWK